MANIYREVLIAMSIRHCKIRYVQKYSYK